MQDIAFTLEKITDAMIHQITPEILVIVRHK
ncbi:capping complex subunit for YIEGIA [Brevibacillus laterosporus]